MYYKAIHVEGIYELEGTLTSLSDGAEVEVELMKLDERSKIKLCNVISSGNVARENQGLFIESIVIKTEDYERFTKGQYATIKDGNRYYITATPRHPVRFSGKFKTVAPDRTNKLFPIQIDIGSIEFDLRDKTGEHDEETVLFENIQATIFQYGHYRLDVID